MSLIRRNVIANIAGRGWSLLISLAVVPIYIRLLGMEAFGLIGLHLTIAAFISLLDFGLGTVINRELARYSTNRSVPQSARDLVRTLGPVYVLVGVGILALCS
jgi:O-antigen/teichoic acid export membrane protein